jgi:hypothetical protein
LLYLAALPLGERSKYHGMKGIQPWPNSCNREAGGSSDDNKMQDSSHLQGEEWLNDSQIANLVFLLLHFQLIIPLDLRDTFQYLYPLPDELFLQMLLKPRPAALLLHAKNQTGITFAFINQDLQHWRLVVMDGLCKKVILIDPLGHSFSSEFIHAVSSFLVKILLL